MIPVRNIVLAILALALLLGFDTFALTPLAQIMSAVAILLSTFGYFLLAFYYRRFPPFMRFMGILFLALFIQSVLATHWAYGQSYKDGLLTNSPVYLTGVMFPIYFFSMRYRISMETLERTLLYLAWGYFFVLLFLYATGAQFAAGEEKAFGVMAMRKGVINLSAFIYVDRFFKRSKFQYLLLAVILFSANHWVDFQRSLFLISLFCMAFMLYHFRKRTAGVSLLIALMLLIPIGSVVINSTEFGKSIAKKFEGAIELLKNEQEDYSDASVEARIKETDFALKSIREHPVIGIGKIKGSNLEQMTGLSYFYISDIGILGILSCFGIPGLFAYLSQWYYWWKNYRRKRFVSVTSITGIKLYMLFALIHTIISGLTVVIPLEFMVLLTLIEIGKFRHEQAL